MHVTTEAARAKGLVSGGWGVGGAEQGSGELQVHGAESEDRRGNSGGAMRGRTERSLTSGLCSCSSRRESGSLSGNETVEST